MMNKILVMLVGLLPLCIHAQQAQEMKQRNLASWKIGTANYSGITSLGGNRYAVVSDKEPTDGFYVFHIDQSLTDGEIVSVYLESFKGNKDPKRDEEGKTVRDCEGIAYHPGANTVFISGEGDQQILEYNMEGQPTGGMLQIPSIFGTEQIVPNMGFEALTYSPENHLFWTTTESTLKKDGEAACPTRPYVQNLLRIQSFGDHLLPVAQYAYRMDKGKHEDFGKIYVLGVSAMTALPDGKLLILEREADISDGYMSSEVICKLFLVDPSNSWQIDSSTDLQKLDPNKFMVKKLLSTFKTKYTPFLHNFANYEGMCLGQKLADGRQTLILISDSQAGFGKGPFRLNDYVKVLVLPKM